MKNAVQILSIILVIQIIATRFTFSGKSNLEGFDATEPLFDLTLNDLDEIVITPGKNEEEKEVTTLLEKEGQWVLAHHFNFPISETKKKMFDNKLFSTKRPLPVGSTNIAAKQFEVSANNFKTKVEFKSDGVVKKTMLIGSSPSFKKVHARFDKEKNTYALTFDGFSLQGKPSTWIERRLLAVDQEKVKKIVFPSFTLLQNTTESSITVEDLAENEEMNTTEAKSLLKGTSSPLYLEVLGDTVKPEYQLTSPKASYTIHLVDGSTREVKLGDVEGEDFFVLKVSVYPYYFKASSYHADKLSGAQRSKLVKEKALEIEDTTSIDGVDAKSGEVGENPTPENAEPIN